MAQNTNHLVWLDMEMTGLDPERERIIELAMVVTDSELNIIAESPSWAAGSAARNTGPCRESIRSSC